MARPRSVHRLPGIIPRQRTPQPKPKRWPWIFLSILFGVCLLGGYWYLYASTSFAIEKVEVTGADIPAIKPVTEHLVGSNIFRLHTSQVEQEIRQVHPPVATVTLVRGLPHTLRIGITLRTPMVRWQSNNETFILDEQGEVFAKGDQPMYAALPKVVDYSNVPVTMGQGLVSPGFIDFLHDIDPLAHDLFGKKIATYEVYETFFHLDVLLEGDIRLRLTTQRPAQEQLQAAQSILLAHPGIHFIDVRVPGRGYYK